MNPFLTSEQVAQLLNCSVRTVETQARMGRLPATKFGDSWIFPADLLIDTVTQLCQVEGDQRKKPKRQFGVKVATAETRKRKIPGLNLLPPEVVKEIMGTS